MLAHLDLLAAALLLATPPAAEPPPAPDVVAARVEVGPRVDGRLDDVAWQQALPFDAFVQSFPVDGAAPGMPTTLRVLHDDDFLYVGVACGDPDPGRIVRPLGRRDTLPPSDVVKVYLDSEHGHRSALVFAVTAAGIVQDGTLDAADVFTNEWDAVWEAGVALGAEGWSAELAIPLRALRFRAASDQTWGIAVEREVARTHEVQRSVAIPRGTRGMVARFGHLVGLTGLDPRRGVEIAPYVASRLVLRPQYDDASRPTPRLADPIGEVGVDARARIGRGLTLDATVNPDFGQVEADQIVLNLTRFETLFPEKRPFFSEGGVALFRPPWQGGDVPPHQLLYSRRIGLDAPILGAAKLSGRVSDRVQVGVVEALVAGAAAPRGTSEDAPGRSLHFHPAQPFRLAPGSAYPALAPLSRNFFAGVVRAQATEGVAVGAQVASAVPFGPSCTEAEAALDDDERPPRCDVRSGHAAALDFDLRTRDGAWGALGQVTASRSAGGPPVRTLSDGTRIARGGAGAGGYVRAGKLGGDPWRLDLRYEYASPGLDLNAVGFQRLQNDQLFRAMAGFLRPRRSGPFHEWELWTIAAARYSTDGRGLAGMRSFWAGGNALLARPYVRVGCEAGQDEPHHDLREIEAAGIPLVRPGAFQGLCFAETNKARPVSAVFLAGAGRYYGRGPLSPTRFWSGEAELALRPHSRAETRLLTRVEGTRQPVRWLEDDGAGTHRFAGLEAPTLSATLRQLVVVTPRLTLQAYAQLFSAYGRYGPFYAATADGARPIRPADLRPASRADLLEDPDFHETALNLSVVARWEYRPGSTVFLVYAREAAELPVADGTRVPASLAPRALASGPTTDTLMLKWTWWMAR